MVKQFAVLSALLAAFALCAVVPTASAGGWHAPWSSRHEDASCGDHCGPGGCGGFWWRIRNAGRTFNPRGYGFNVHMTRPCGCAHVYRSGAEYPRYIPGVDGSQPGDACETPEPGLTAPLSVDDFQSNLDSPNEAPLPLDSPAAGQR